MKRFYTILSVAIAALLMPFHVQAEEVTVKYAMAVGETHAVGDKVELKSDKGKVLGTVQFGMKDVFHDEYNDNEPDFTAAKASIKLEGFEAYTEGNGEAPFASYDYDDLFGGYSWGFLEAGKTVYLIEVNQECKLEIATRIKVGELMYVFECRWNDGFLDLAAQQPIFTYLSDAKDAQDEIKMVTINAEAGKVYKVLATNSCLGFFGLNLTYSKAEYVELEYQKYLVKNVATEKFWSAGNSWGTQASLVDHPEYVMFSSEGMEEGFYKLESQVSNGGQSIFFNGDYMDSDKPVALTIMKVGSYYTIASGENYYGWDGKSTVLGKNLTADDRNALWSIITLDSAKTALKDATLAHPIDATMLIEDHDFGRNNRYASNWETWSETANAGTDFKISGGEDGNGSVGNNCAESYHAKFTLKQTLTGVPKGVYALTAQGFYRQDGSDNDHLPYFYANDEKQVFPLKTGAENSMTDAGKSFKNGLYTIDPIYVEVKEGGELVIGAKLEENTNLWCIWDNFVLTYYGPDATIEAVKSIAPLVENYMKAQDVLFGTIDVETARMALQDAANMAMEEVLQLDEEGTLVLKEGATQEKIQATIDALKAGMEKVSAVAKVTPVLRAMENVANSTNIYTQEAYAAYKQIYDGLVDKYGKAEFTVAETANLENPETNLGWHTENSVDDFLLSAWSIGETKCRNYEAGMYVNVWSTEGDNDGSNFRTPFYEYWTGDGESLAANKLSATMGGLVPEGTYNVTAWVRVRLKNGAAAPATGITLQAGAGEAVDVAAGEQVGTSQFYLKEFSATGEADQTGNLTIQFNIAADNNISWLSFKNVKLEYSGGDIYHKIDKSTVLDVPYISSLNETERLWLKGGRNTRKMGLTINPELAEDAQKELQGTMFEGIQINPAVSGAQFQTLIKGADYVVAYVVSEVEASFTLTATENVEDAEVMPEVKATTKEMAHHHSTEVVRLALDKDKEYRIDYTSNETDVVLHYVEFIVTNEKLEAAYDSLKNEIEAANKLHTEYLADATLENYLAALQLIIDRAPNGFAFSKEELVYKSVKLLQDAETDFRKVVQGYVDLRARVKEVTDFRNKEVKEFLDSIGDQTALMAEFETLLKDLDDAFEQADKALQGKDVDNVVLADINLTRCEVYLSLRMHINQAETSYKNYIFGEEALKEILGEAVAKAAEEMRDATLAAVEAYKGSDNQAAEDARQALIDAEEKFAEVYNKAVEDYNTGITTLKTNANGGAIYNMQGVKMQKADTKGIYIVNGKKLIVK